jgi:hypothetical protein
VFEGANPTNVIFALKDLKLFDDEKVMRFFTMGMQDQEPVQLWHCDFCTGTLFYIAPKVNNDLGCRGVDVRLD